MHHECKLHMKSLSEKVNTEKPQPSKDNRSDLLPYIPRWNLRNFCLLGCRNAGHEVPLVPPTNLCLFYDLVTEVQAEEEDDIDV